MSAGSFAPGVFSFSALSGTVSAAQIADGSITSSKFDASLAFLNNPFLQRVTTALSMAQVGSAPIADANPIHVAIQGRYAYVCGNDGSGAGKFYVFDVSNPASPVLQGETGIPLTPVRLVVSGNFAYVLGSSYGLITVDVSNPASPAYRTFTPTGSVPRDIALSGNALFVVNSVSADLQVFDISVPGSPVQKADVGAGVVHTGPNAITIAGNRAYVVSGYATGLQVYDISAPFSPTLLGSAPANEFNYSVAAQGAYAYVLSVNPNALLVYNVSVPASPTLVGSVPISVDTSLGVVRVAGGAAYVITRDSAFLAFDVSNPAAPALLKSVPVSAGPYTLAINNNYAYAVNPNNFALQVFSLYGTELNSNLLVDGSLTASGGLIASQGIVFGDGTALTTARGAAGGDLTGTFPNPTVKNGAITGAKIASGTITAANLAAGVFPTSLPPNGNAGGDLTGSYPNPTIAANAVTTAKIPDNAVTTSKIADSAITSAKIANGTILAADLAAGVIPASLPPSGSAGGDLTGTYPAPVIAANAVSNAKLATDPASLAKITGGLIVLNGGFIGVNTATAMQQLDVNGRINVANGVIQRGGAPISATSDLGLYSQVGGDWIRLVTNNAPIKFFTDGVSGTAGAIGTNPVMTIVNNVVGIGVDAPAANYKLQVAGVIAGSGNYVNTSDRRFKQNIATYDNALDAILNLRGVTFDWRKDEFKAMNFADGRQIGFIAQEVEKVLPELVMTDDKGYKSVAYANITAVLVEAVKTQQKQIEQQEKRIKALEIDNAQVKEQKEAIEELKKQLAAVLEALKQKQTPQESANR